MIKVKDGYGKLIGTTYQGSATQVLLSNGGNLELSSETKANTLVQRNASQHIYATYFNSAISDEALTDIGSVYVRNTSDTFIRRISKTRFYSIIDNKFVTLDTAQTITGVKTFSTGPILANNATITQNQNSTSNYTTVVKWLKGGTSQGTYNPSIGQHNTGGDGTGSICILPYPTSTDPLGGTVGLFIGKGVLRLDGKAVAIAKNYYTKTESDERYVNVTGDTMTGPLIVKASITGTQLISNIADGTAPLKVTSKTVVTNLNSDLLDGYHETSFFRARGSQTIASSIPTTTELSSNNNLSGNWNVTYPGASGHLVQFNTGGGSTRYMQFYSYYSGSLYWRNSSNSTLNTKSWKTIVDSANYTGIVLRIGTATKGSATLPIYLNAGTPTACSTTLGVSITGNAATATKLQTARTINGTSFNGSANITTAYWGATRTITLSGAVTGSASVNGSQNVTITTTYQTGSIDERYVNVTGDTMTGPLIVKASITGTQLISNIADGTAPLKVTSKTVVTNLNSDLLDGYHETSFFRARGSQTIASSIPTTTELSSNNNLSGNWNVTYPGASGHLVQFNTGGGSTRYMQFYSYYSGSLYWRNSSNSTLNTKSWKTIVDSANYTGIVLRIGTATKGSATLPIYLNAGTPTACSTTLGVSITGNAATATKLQTARTINGTSFNGSANITTAYWGATRTITLSGAVTGSASVNGSQNVTITTTYQTGSIDERYVGGKKIAGHGSQGTAYTADTYSSNFVNKAFVAYAERGSWAYANNGYITTDTGVNIPLAGTAIFQWGASDTNKTQLFITPMNNSGVSNPAVNEMLFYTSNGSKYSSGWSRVLTNRNYTIYTVTKTGGGASGTWGISITGNAATANRIISHSISDTLANKTTPGYLYHAGGSNSVKDKPSGVDAFGVFTMQTASGWYGQLLMSSNTSTGLYWRTATSLNGGWKKILDSSNYTAYVNPANFVTSLGTNGNYVTWTKNGTTNNLTVPFATTSNVLNNLGNRTAISGTTVGQRGLRLYKVYNNGYPVNFGNVLNIGGQGYGELLFQWTGDSNPGHLYYRSKRDAASQAWSNWVTILDNNNYSSTLDGRYVTLATNQTVSGIKTFSTQQKFTVATGTSPFTVSSTTVVSNLNADMLDGWHLNYILKDGFVTSATSGLSSYWRKVWDITLNNQYNDVDINLLVHSACNQQWGIISFKLRQNGTGTAKNISAYLAEVVGNIPLDRFRLYYNNSSGLCQLWCNPSGQYNVYNYRVLAKTWRTGTEVATLGTFYTGNTSTAQSLPSDSYVSMAGITIVNTAAKVANTLTFSAGKFSSKTYNGSSAITVNVPTHTSHLTNDSGFWTGTRYWANIAVSTSSSTSTSPTFSTAFTSNWFRSTGSTGWYSQTYGGGWYMADSTWIRTFGSKSVYQNTGQIRTDGYLVTYGGLTAGATSPNNGTYKLHVTGASWSSGLIRAGGGFYHNSVNSNSYVLLAGGSYKGLGDFAKGNAGSATKGVYVTGGTVTAMTYSLSSNLNSGTSGKLAYYSSATTVAAYSSSVGASNRGVYMNAGVPTVMAYYLNATVNSGASGKLAYYSGTNSIDDYTNTIGSSSTPIYINNGIPNAANGYKVVNSGHYFSAFGISGYIYVIRYGQVVCVSINMSSGGNGSTGTTTLLTNLPSAVYTTGQSASKGGGSALRQATFYVSGTTLYVYSYQADQLPNRVSFTYITNTLK